jgi:hypothetical protein
MSVKKHKITTIETLRRIEAKRELYSILLRKEHLTASNQPNDVSVRIIDTVADMYRVVWQRT